MPNNRERGGSTAGEDAVDFAVLVVEGKRGRLHGVAGRVERAQCARADREILLIVRNTILQFH